MSLADTPAPYTPFWCEENVYQLIATLDDPSRAYAVFISNPERTCILFQQAASARGAEAGHYVVWDYHVIVVTTLEDGSVAVLDRDSRLPQPMLLEGEASVRARAERRPYCCSTQITFRKHFGQTPWTEGVIEPRLMRWDRAPQLRNWQTLTFR